MTIKSLHDTYRSEGSCSKEVESCFETLEHATNKSYISLSTKADIKDAIAAANKNIKNNTIRGLEGICVSLKDLFLVEGRTATG